MRDIPVREKDADFRDGERGRQWSSLRIRFVAAGETVTKNRSDCLKIFYVPPPVAGKDFHRGNT